MWIEDCADWEDGVLHPDSVVACLVWRLRHDEGLSCDGGKPGGVVLVEERRAAGVSFAPSLAGEDIAPAGGILVHGMEYKKPSLVSLDGRRPRANLSICPRHILASQEELLFAPVFHVGREGVPDVEGVAPLVGRTLQAHVFAANPLGEKHHVALLRNPKADDVEVNTLATPLGDAGALGVLVLKAEGQVETTLQDGQAGVDHPGKGLAMVEDAHQLGLHLPVDAVVAPPHAGPKLQCRTVEMLVKQVDTGRNDKTAVEKVDARVEDKGGRVGDVVLGKDGIPWITVQNRVGMQLAPEGGQIFEWISHA